MPNKPARYCARCRTVHAAECPQKPVHNWDNKRQGQQSGRGGSSWRGLRLRIFERDSYLCQICLRAGKYKAVDLHGYNHGVCDHIVPTTKGGTDDEDNLQTICQACNKVKTQAESIAVRKNFEG